MNIAKTIAAIHKKNRIDFVEGAELSLAFLPKIKEIKYLFISYVVYLEELLNANKITQEEYQSKRKQILDSGNSAIRRINEQIESIFSNLKID